MIVDPRDAVVREIHIAASPDHVFEYFVDPARMIQWKGIVAQLDPRPGGIYRVDMNGRDVIVGTFVELDRPRRVVMTFGWDGPESIIPAGSTRVAVDLFPDGNGTLVRLTHSGLPTEAAERHAIGWEHYLGRLALVGSGSDPGRDPWLDQ